jgi:hypothetical protein
MDFCSFSYPYTSCLCSAVWLRSKKIAPSAILLRTYPPLGEYSVEADCAARKRELAAGPCAVPVLVEDGKVVPIGSQGRSCFGNVD